MARTPLMQSLVRLAAEHELADRLKVPVEEVRRHSRATWKVARSAA
jgi:hypothetical protein